MIPFVTFLILSWAAISCSALLSTSFPQKLRLKLFFVFLGCGPILLAYFLEVLLRLLPEQPLIFYTASLFAALILTTFFSISPIKKLFHQFKYRAYQAHLLDMGLFVFLFVFLLLYFWQSLLLPLTQNDALQYATMARIFFSELNLTNYPFIKAHSTGFMAGTCHPLANHMLIFFTYLIQGHSDSFGAGRIIHPLYLIFQCLAIIGFLGYKRLRIALLTCILLLSIPATYQMALSFSIDSLRIYGVMAAVFSLYFTYSKVNATYKMIFWSLFPAIYSHNLGIILIPFYAFYGAAQALIKGNKSLAFPFLSLFPPLLLWGFHYIINFQHFGSPISDNLEMWSHPLVGWKDFVLRASEQTDLTSRLLSSLKIFTQLDNFGFIYLGAAVSGLLVVLLKKYREKVLLTPCLFILFFFALLFYSNFTGMPDLTDGIRYVSTIAPFACLVLVITASKIFGNTKNGSIATVITIFLLSGLSPFSHNIRDDINLTIKKLTSEDLAFHGDEYRAINKLEYFNHFDFIKKGSQTYLIFRMAEFPYYSRNLFIRDYDPRLIPAYENKDPESAFNDLKDLEIDRLYLPNYAKPTIYNTSIRNLLFNPRFSNLVFQNSLFSIFDLELNEFTSQRIEREDRSQSILSRGNIVCDFSDTCSSEVVCRITTSDNPVIISGNTKGSGFYEIFLITRPLNSQGGNEFRKVWSEEVQADKKAIFIQTLIPEKSCFIGAGARLISGDYFELSNIEFYELIRENME